MRIDDLNRAPAAQGAEKTDQVAQKRGPGKDSASAADQADVSQLAQALTSSDPQRLEQLRLAVQSGAYEVSAEAVAKAIVDYHSTD
ncbi:MAG: flagellar biosynthesis anti-sigma factor FlgM [Bryobacteraceae bacterium]|jgi:flagellar biosynthesis anti-sigma factor FlgM